MLTQFVDDYKTRTHMVEQTKRTQQMAVESLKRAKEGGVSIVLGTDNVGWPAADNFHEARCLVKAGLTPREVLRAATSTSALLMNVSTQLGRLEKGFLADIIGLCEDPTHSVESWGKVAFVFSKGKLIRKD